MAAAVELENVELHDLVDGSDQDLPAGKRQRSVRRIEVGIANRVEHDVGTAAVGQLPDPGRNIPGARIDDLDRSVGVAFISLVLAHDADHFCSAPAGKLGGRLADLAVKSNDKNGLVRTGHPGPAKAFQRRDERHPDPRRLFHRYILRLFHQRRRFDDKMRRMRAVTADAEIARRAEDLAAQPLVRTLDDDTRKVAAWRPRENGIRHQAGGRLDIRWIYA